MESFQAIISSLASTDSRNAKIELLEKFKNDQQVRQLLDFTYNPEHVYGVKKIEFPTVEGGLSLREHWERATGLLINLEERALSGNAAREAVTNFLSTLTIGEQEVFAKILKGDLRCGINVSTINKAIPNLIPETPYMRCSLPKDSNIEKFDWESGIYSQEKADGMFVNIIVSNDGPNTNKVELKSRNGTKFYNRHFAGIVGSVLSYSPRNVVYHGELVVFRNGDVLPREIGNGVLNSVLKGGEFQFGDKPFFFVWDVVPLQEFTVKGTSREKYSERFNHIRNYHTPCMRAIPTRMVHSYDEAMAHYMDLTSQGKEGTILKRPAAKWVDRTSKDQVKFKVEAEVDLLVTGYNKGNGKNADTFGSLTCISSCGNLEVSVSGFTDDQRAAIWDDIDNWIGKKVVTVRANGIMPATTGLYSLFLPRFVEERNDKEEADSLERIKQIFESVIKGN